MKSSIENLVEKYCEVSIIGYEDEDYYVILEDSKVHEKDLLEDTMDAIRNKINYYLDDYCFSDARNTILDLEKVANYYDCEWQV